MKLEGRQEHEPGNALEYKCRTSCLKLFEGVIAHNIERLCLNNSRPDVPRLYEILIGQLLLAANHRLMHEIDHNICHRQSANRQRYR